jgi:hypothetical protein
MKNSIVMSATSAWRPMTQRTTDKTESIGEQLQSSGISSIRRRMLTDERFNVTKVNQIFITSWIDHTRSPTRTIRRLIRTGTGSQLIILSTSLVEALSSSTTFFYTDIHTGNVSQYNCSTAIFVSLENYGSHRVGIKERLNIRLSFFRMRFTASTAPMTENVTSRISATSRLRRIATTSKLQCH